MYSSLEEKQDQNKSMYIYRYQQPDVDQIPVADMKNKRRARRWSIVFRSDGSSFEDPEMQTSLLKAPNARQNSNIKK